MSTIIAIEQAIFFSDRRDQMDRVAREDAASVLGGLGVFSSRQVAAIVGLPVGLVCKITGKSDKTGGRFRPEALRPLLTVARQRANGEVDDFAIAEALDAGVSPGFAARMTKVPRTTLMRRYERAKEATA